MDNVADDFMPIPITEFVQGVTIPVDLYIKLSDEKFVMVGKAGAHSNVDQFKNYQDREVVYLWVKKKEYYKITHQTITIAGIALAKKDLSDGKKTTMITHSTRAMFRQIEGVGLDLETYNNSKQVCDAVLGLVDTHKSLTDLLSSLKDYSDQLMSHSVAVSVLSVMIGQGLKYEKKATLEKLALGGLLHDIGMKAVVPQELLKKPMAQMTPEEVQNYETHAFKGMQMLQSLGIVPDDIVSIIYEHHENAIGQGFPQRIRDVKMHPLARVVALADAYANLILPNVNCPVPKNPREALMYIEHTLGIPYNREAFRALKKIVEGGERKAA
jgi:putative nucleotidyltransferase with HDIG domain